MEKFRAFFFCERGDRVMNLTNTKQEAFCLHYAKTGNACESYKVAGYTAKNDNTAIAGASRLLKKVSIQERIRELRSEVEKPAIMEISEMQERLSAIGRMEVQEEVATAKGVVVRKKVGAADAIKAITQLAKMQGVAENVNLNVSIPIISGETDLED